MGYARTYRNENNQTVSGQIGLLAPSTFVADWCCEHMWQWPIDRDEKVKVQRCAACGASCERDRRGMIIEYFRPVKGFTDTKD